MTKQVTFDLFTRATFGLEPGSEVGKKLKRLATYMSLCAGQDAPVDRWKDQLAYIASGSTKLAAIASESREQIVAFHFGGDVFSIPADATHAHVLTSLGETQLLVFPAKSFLDLASEEAGVARCLLERFRLSLHRCRDKAVGLGRKTAPERIAGFLVSMAERLGAGEVNSASIELPMSRRDIGDSLGLTIETVSRQLGTLRKAGLIETHGRSRIDLIDIGELARRAGHVERPPGNCACASKFDLDQCLPDPARLTLGVKEGA